MTLRDLIKLADQHPEWPALFFGLMMLLTVVLPLFHKKGQGALAPWKYFYSTLTYLVCIPGMMAGVLVGYALFFTRENLLDANILVTGMPLFTMFVCLVLIGKQVSFQDLPGFDRLSGLMILIGGAFAIALLISKLFVGIFFGGSIVQLLAIGTAVFLLLKWATHTLFRGRGQARRPRPSLFS
ncbi:MAG: hypothetical protein CVV27_02050 [Candidatus Melainabacteria bacterium HGW-Melainabacteria-1]|nr:MAG: hypothetical protein CVV27_02050 [Candidatus Melainabacteria bacterium HGW-Melainabacteria-1]